MSADDRDVRLEELLRTSLSDEADTIMPAGDGLARIQRRVSTRRTRAAWFQPLAALGSVAIIAVAGFAAYALTRTPDKPSNLNVTNIGNSTSPSASASSTPSAPPVAKPTYPVSAFYPFTSETAETQWEAQGGPAKQPWVLDPTLLAKNFVAGFLELPDVTDVYDPKTVGNTATVTLGRTLHDGNRSLPIKVTTVHMARFGQAWVVTGATDPAGNLTLTAPRAGQTVTSPTVVSGPGFGVDEGVRVDVRSISGIDRIGTAPSTNFGNGTPSWSVSVAFSSPDPRGAIVAEDVSAADGGPGRVTVTGVNFATVQPASYPRYFYGVKNGRVAKFASRDGGAISYLTAAEPGGGASDPQLSGDTVYYLQGGGTCLNELRSVPAAGGTPATVASPDPGYVISGFGVSPTSTLALFETACTPTPTQPQGKLVSTQIGSSSSHTIEFQSFPPVVVGDPTWAPDGQHVLVVVRTGTQASVRSYDAFAAKSADDATSPCTLDPSLGLPTSVQVDAAGTPWIAAQTGSSMAAYRCAGGIAQEAFTVTGNDTPGDLAVAGNGQAVLLTDTSGAIWRWSQGGVVTQLHPTVPLTQVSW